MVNVKAIDKPEGADIEENSPHHLPCRTAPTFSEPMSLCLP